MNIILFDKGVRRFEPSDQRYVHIRDVLSLGVGDTFTAGEYNACRGLATITRFDADGLDFSFQEGPYDGRLHPLTLLLASVRPICMKRILREVVSLGVGRIVVTGSALGEKSYLSSGLYRSDEHLEIMRSGAMQSGHTGLSTIEFVPSLEKAASMCAQWAHAVLLDIDADARPLSSMDLSGDAVTLAIGGERGWSDDERGLFRGLGYVTASMGDRILRSETAAVAGVALALSRMPSTGV